MYVSKLLTTNQFRTGGDNMKDLIHLTYIEKGRIYEGSISKTEILSDMEYIKNRYSDNNENAKRLIKIIPKAIKITINSDYNETQDMPFVTFTYYDGKVGMLKIHRTHSVIWGFFNRYCQDIKD